MLRVPVDDPQHAGPDQRRESRRLDVVQVGHDGVHLEDHHLELHEQLVEHVERADGRGVAAAEHQADAPGRRIQVGRGHRGRQRLGRDRAVHPDVCAGFDVRRAINKVRGRDSRGHGLRAPRHGRSGRLIFRNGLDGPVICVYDAPCRRNRAGANARTVAASVVMRRRRRSVHGTSCAICRRRARGNHPGQRLRRQRPNHGPDVGAHRRGRLVGGAGYL